MCTKYLLVALLLPASSLYAQNSDNYIDVVANTSLNFAINTVSKIESDQTITGALTVGFKNKDRTREIYARVSSVTAPSGFTPTSPYPIQIDYTSDNSSNESNLIQTPLTLTSTDQRLFTQVKKNSTFFQFNYNLIFKATNWLYPPGNYAFTLLFTMTPP
jgi:hypothetical protein